MKKHIIFLLSGVGALAALTCAFFLGRYSASREDAGYEQAYEQAEADVAVVKRVSQQMEEIAYQQLAISDQQRVRAEQQSELALANAERAATESRAARKAESKALEALDEAERQRAKALVQEQLAVDQLRQTQLQRSISDTLNYRTLGRSIASTAIAQFEAGNIDLSALLSYASWYFIDKFKGNTYQAQSFWALELNSSEIHKFSEDNGAPLSSISKITAECGDGCVVATRYGGIVKWEHVSSGKPRISRLFQDKTFDFRDVELLDNGDIWALSVDGRLLHLLHTGSTEQFQLPYDALYFNIMKLTPTCFWMIGQRAIYTFDSSSALSQTAWQSSPSVTLSNACMKGDVLLLFLSDGSCAELTRDGKISHVKPLVDGVVTASYFDKKRQCLFVGEKDGTITAVSHHGLKVVMTGHVSAVTDLDLDGNVLISSSYDKNVFVWNLDKLQLPSGRTFDQEMQATTVQINEAQVSEGVRDEWLVPANIDFDGWPLCLTLDRDQDYMWVGTSNGQLYRYNYSISQIAERVHKSLHRNLTLEEWNSYIGSNIPYVKFK